MQIKPTNHKESAFMGLSQGTMPEAKFDFRPNQATTKEDITTITVTGVLKESNGRLCFSPNKRNLLAYMNSAIGKSNTNLNYLIRSITLKSYANSSNQSTSIAFYLHHYEESKSNQIVPVECIIQPEAEPKQCNTVVYKHPYPNDITFYAYPSYKDAILKPDLKSGKDTAGNSVVFVDINSPFYFVYKDMYHKFYAYVEKLKTPRLLNAISVKVVESPYVSLMPIAVEMFRAFISETIYSQLKFIDLKTSFLTINPTITEFTERHIESFQSDLKNYFSESISLNIHDGLPFTSTFEISYVTIDKYVDPREKAIVMSLFRHVDPKTINMAPDIKFNTLSLLATIKDHPKAQIPGTIVTQVDEKIQYIEKNSQVQPDVPINGSLLSSKPHHINDEHHNDNDDKVVK